MQCTLDSFHHVYYDTRVRPTPDDVVSSLVGLEKLIIRMPDVLRIILPGGPERVEVYVEQVQAGSLKENIFVRLVWGSEEALDQWITQVRRATGVELMDNKLPILGPVFTGLIVFGLGVGAGRMLNREGGGNGSVVNISNVTSSVISTGAGMLRIDEDAFAQALRDGAGNALIAATNACRVIKPAKRLDAARPSVLIDGNEAFRLGPEVIAEVPSHIDRSVVQPEQRVEENEEIVVRALDLDNGKKGWFVVVPRLFDKRIPMELDPEVNGASITAGKSTRADIELYYTLNDEGDRKYRNAYLRKLR